MRPDNANAMGMILMFLSTLGIIYVFGKIREAFWGRRIGAALLAGLLILVFTSIGFVYKCILSSTTGYRSCWFSLCAMLIALFVPKRTIVIISCVVILFAGIKLNSHYTFLVNKTGTFAYLADNGCTYNYTCPDESSGGVKAKALWHTILTEIYLVE